MLTIEETRRLLGSDEVKLIRTTRADDGCVTDPTLADAAARVPDLLNRYQHSSDTLKPELDFNYQVDNKHWQDFTLVANPWWNMSIESSKTTWRCGIDDVLTLSLGVLASGIPYRTYDHQAVPHATGNQDTLIVNGNSRFTPQGVALLNFKLHTWDVDPEPGLFLSTGPVFKFGGTPGISTFGWFGGASLGLWHSLFLSTGMHMGQFADFPPGFTNGSVIPANFGSLTPSTRWTSRFAFAVSFQTKSLVKSSKSSATADAGSTPAPGKAKTQ